MAAVRERILRWIAGVLDTDPNALLGAGRKRAEFTSEELNDYIQIHDRGADVTVFTFSGLAPAFAGLPVFEFNRQLSDAGQAFNLVYMRDIRRMCYHLRPDGQPDGLSFFESAVQGAMRSLNAKYNVAVGTSVGGSAALYFATKCGMNQAIAFSPGYPLTVYASPLSRLRTIFDVPMFFRDRRAYAELLLTTMGTTYTYRQLCRQLGKANIWPILDLYRSATPRPRATIFYGKRCRPDAYQASLFAEFPEMKLVPVATHYHNSAAVMRREERLMPSILAELREGIAAEGMTLAPTGVITSAA